MGALDKLDAFATQHAAAFYGLPPLRSAPRAAPRLMRAPTPVPRSFPFGAEDVVPLRAGGEVAWTLVGGELE